LARSRLLRISQKREDWNASDLNLNTQDQGLIDKSLEKFISALCHLDEPQVALLGTEFDGMACFTIGEAAQNSHWARYAQAAALVLQQQQPLSKGLVGVASGTLIGAGLSSSASVGLAYLSGLAAVNDISLTADILVELDRKAGR